MVRYLRLLSVVIVGLLLCATVAHAQQSKSSLTSTINTNFPDNTTGLITPLGARSTFGAMVNSWQQYAGVNAQTGTTYTFALTDYGQLVTFNNSGSVAVGLPQATGSFRTWSTYVQNLGAGTVTITPTTSTINGAPSYAIPSSGGVFIVSDGTNYQVWQPNIFPSIISNTVLGNATASTAAPTGLAMPSCTTSGLTWTTNTGFGCNNVLSAIPADNLLGNPSGSPAAVAAIPLPNSPSCSGAQKALTYDTSAHTFGCNTISGGGTVLSGLAGQLGYYSGSTNVIGGNADATMSAGVLTLGINSASTGGPVVGGLVLEGSSTGFATIQPTSGAAGTPTLTVGTSSGTIVATAASPLSVNSGTGQVSITGATGGVLAGSGPAFTATPTLGTSGTTGILNFAGSSSGLVSVTVAASAGTWTLQLPANAGSSGQFLETNGGGIASWANPTGSGTVSSGSTGQMTYYSGSPNSTTVSGNSNANISAGNLTLGQSGTTIGKILLAGNTSGTATIAPQAVAGTPTLTIGTSSGTIAAAASSPLAINSTTGQISITGAAGQVLNGSPAAFTATPILGNNGGTTGKIFLTGATSGNVGLTVYDAAGNYNLKLPNTAGSSGQFMQTDGSGNASWAAPSFASTSVDIGGPRPWCSIVAKGAIGNAGAGVSVNAASPAVVTWNTFSGQLSANQKVTFLNNSTGTATLPTGLSFGTVYFVVGASIMTNQFSVSATSGGAAINTTGSTSSGVGIGADDSGAINTCITEVVNNGGGMVWFDAGHYCTLTGITVAANGVTVAGPNRGTTILDACGIDVTTMEIAGVDDVAQEITFWGPNFYTANNYALYLGPNCIDCQLTRVTAFYGKTALYTDAAAGDDIIRDSRIQDSFGSQVVANSGAYYFRLQDDFGFPYGNPSPGVTWQPPAWQANHSYTAGQFVRVQNSNPSGPYILQVSPLFLQVTGTASGAGGVIELTVDTTPHTTAPTTGMTTNDQVIVFGVLGTTEANNTPGNPFWLATVIDGTHISLQGSTWVHAWTGNGGVEDKAVAFTSGSSEPLPPPMICCTVLDGSGPPTRAQLQWGSGGALNRNCMDIESAFFVEITISDFSGPCFYGLHLGGSSGGFHLSDSDFDAAMFSSLEIAGTSFITGKIANNQFNGCLATGCDNVEIQSTGYSDITLTGNSYQGGGTGTIGLFLSGSSTYSNNATVTSNGEHFNGHSSEDIFINAGISNFIIQGDSFGDQAVGSSGKGIVVSSGGSTGYTIRGNACWNVTPGPCITDSGTGTAFVDGNYGYNPSTPTTVSLPNGSAYTAKHAPETHWMTGGTLSGAGVQIGGNTVCSATPCTVHLPANGQMVVTYSSTPTDVVYRE